MVLNRVLAGEWTPAQAAPVLGLSERQVRRLLGASGREARRPWCTATAGGRRRTAAGGGAGADRRPGPGTKYAGFNHQHLTEKLDEVEGLPVGRTTVRRVLLGAGLRSPRTRRAPKHRQRRERMAQDGLLLQADGSRHRWLGPDGPCLTLIGGIDDATGTVPSALFRTQEDAQGYMVWLRQVASTQGVPHALYVDRHGIFERRKHEPLTLEEELAGGPRPTQFGRVLAELGITAIHAQSPQAKGRVERLWGTFQDRLCGELRLAGARTLADANRVLWAFLPALQRPFRRSPAEPGTAYRPLPARPRPGAGLLLQVRAGRGGGQHRPPRRAQPATPPRPRGAASPASASSSTSASTAAWPCTTATAAWPPGPRPPGAGAPRPRGPARRPRATGPDRTHGAAGARPRGPDQLRPAPDPPLEAEALHRDPPPPPRPQHLAMNDRPDTVAEHSGGQSPWSATPGRQGGGPPAAAPGGNRWPLSVAKQTLPENS